MTLGNVIKWGVLIAIFGGPGCLVFGAVMAALGLGVFAVVFAGCVIYVLLGSPVERLHFWNRQNRLHDAVTYKPWTPRPTAVFRRWGTE